MNISKKSKAAKKANGGFTLVELIVVLVILAILAAILVPALLGWIDKAKEKQYVLDARSLYMAAQAKLSEKYANDPNGAETTDYITEFSREDTIDILNTADVNGKITLPFIVELGAEKGHSHYTIQKMLVTMSDGTACFLKDGIWDVSNADSGKSNFFENPGADYVITSVETIE